MDWNHAAQVGLVVLCFVLSGFGVMLASKLPGLTQKALDWLTAQTSHVQNAYAQGLLQRALVVVGQIVLEIENVEIEALKAKLAGGSITPDQLPSLLADLKNAAQDKVKAHFDAQGLSKDLQTVVFGGQGEQLSQWIGTAIEAAVSQLPASGLQTSKNGVTPPAVAANSKTSVPAVLTETKPEAKPNP